MRPAFSVVFLTTLIGAGQGLFAALFGAEAAARAGVGATLPDAAFFVAGALVVLVFLGLGLFASFFHLGRPERAWRSAAKWRTSWLSREVIALPAFMVLVAGYGWAHWTASGATLALGAAALLACAALYYCTAMIYACVRFLREWASPLTVANFCLLGLASGFTLAIPVALGYAPHLVEPYAVAALVLTLAALGARLASLARNARLKPKSTLQSAIGIRHERIAQKSQGFTGSSFNTREFFHGVTPARMRAIRRGFVLLAFVAPALMLVTGLAAGAAKLLAAAFVIQYAGLVAERWFFLAQANHPQNLYYQSIA